MTYIVTRQANYGTDPIDEYMVQLSDGGWDHVGPGKLVEQYIEQGEDSEHDDPRQALEACIRVAEAWTRDTGVPKYIEYSYGSAAWIIPFAVETYNEGRARAEEEFENLPKCDECGKVLSTNKRDIWRAVEPELLLDDEAYCSEFCANSAIQEALKDLHLDEEEEESED